MDTPMFVSLSFGQKIDTVALEAQKPRGIGAFEGGADLEPMWNCFHNSDLPAAA